jgi:Orsellinic acid/F9775 biosynthesis cluster protein D
MFHGDIDLRVRKQLTEYVKDLEIDETRDVRTPIREIMVVEGLKVHHGFICTVGSCGHLRTTVASIQQHCREKHAWIEQRGTVMSI